MSKQISPQQTIKGRGSLSNKSGRFESLSYESQPDAWASNSDFLASPNVATTLYNDSSRSVITYNDSPDIPFDRSINPYRGCEHGCIYCYARPSHAWLGLSPGIDFESKIFAKSSAAALLTKELSSKNYKVQPIALGSNTDPYQPVERTQQITRQILSVLLRFRHPVTIVTKSPLILRDIDLLKALATQNLVKVFISLGTLNAQLARMLEPRAPQPRKRLQAILNLVEQKIPTGVLVAPIIPGLNDYELEEIIQRVAGTGITNIRYNLLRLPYELGELFEEWLQKHYPNRKNKILSLIRQSRDGKLNDSAYSQRMIGQGNYAHLIQQRFRLICQRLGVNKTFFKLRTDLFEQPQQQLSLL